MEKQRPREVKPFPQVTQFAGEWDRHLLGIVFLVRAWITTPCSSSCMLHSGGTLLGDTEPHVAPSCHLLTPPASGYSGSNRGPSHLLFPHLPAASLLWAGAFGDFQVVRLDWCRAMTPVFPPSWSWSVTLQAADGKAVTVASLKTVWP